jgi:predicted RNase H-like HicB family nuclease
MPTFFICSLRFRPDPRTSEQHTTGSNGCPDTGLYVGYVPGFSGAHSQAESLDELNENLREVIAMLLEDGEPPLETELVGIQTVLVA